jgi:hypothetical protein
MWMPKECEGSFNWNTAFTCARDCLAGGAKLRLAGLFLRAGERIFAPNANVESMRYGFLNYSPFIHTRIQTAAA